MDVVAARPPASSPCTVRASIACGGRLRRVEGGRAVCFLTHDHPLRSARATLIAPWLLQAIGMHLDGHGRYPVLLKAVVHEDRSPLGPANLHDDDREGL